MIKTITMARRYLGMLIFSGFFSTVISAARTRLTWVNGIGYSLDHMKSGQVEISKIFGGKKVEFCHNVSFSVFCAWLLVVDFLKLSAVNTCMLRVAPYCSNLFLLNSQPQRNTKTIFMDIWEISRRRGRKS